VLNTIAQKILWLLYFVWFVGFVFLGIKFAQNNPSPLAVDLLFWVTPTLSSGVLMGLALLIGVILGVVMFLPVVFLSRYRVRRLQSKLKQMQFAS
jgi:uncharacterized integral membrane protein